MTQILTGYTHFPDFRPFKTKPIMDGVQLRGAPKPLPKTPSHGANILEMFDGSAVVILDYHDDDAPDTAKFFKWEFTHRAGFQYEWLKIQEVQEHRSQFWWVPFDYVTSAFTAGRSLQAFKMTRPTAKSQVTGFDTEFAKYSIAAFINGVQKTVVENLTPASGEVGVLGYDVVTGDTLSAGDKLRIVYVPAYKVIMDDGPETLEEYNSMTKAISLREVRRS